MERQLSEGLNPHVVIIGGGPVGLWTAVQTKILLPGASIVIIEKYKEYKRSHVLRLNKMSMVRAPAHSDLQKLIDRIPKVVRTNVLEDELLTLAKKLDISIVYKNITDVRKEIHEMFPGCMAVIGADGSHSITREQIFGGAMSVQETLKQIVEIKYEVNGPTRKLNFVTEFYPTQKMIDFITEESVGKIRDGKTPVTVRFLVTKKIYEQMKDATFKNPFYVPTHRDRIPEKLLEAIILWINVRKHCTKEERVDGSEKISALHLDVYQSDKVTYEDKEHHRAYFLVGDAAFGVPFFRALNNGLLCGSKLAFCLNDLLSEHLKSYTPKSLMGKLKVGVLKAMNTVHNFVNAGVLNAYSMYVSSLAMTEVATARTKSGALFAANIMNKVNGAVPWQVNVWPKEKEKLFLTTDPDFKPPFIVQKETTQERSSDVEVDHNVWQGPEGDSQEEDEDNINEKEIVEQFEGLSLTSKEGHQ
jgi:hypothetical protein